MRFICDQMLARLGRWLRAAGYDTEIVEEPLSDQEVWQQAIETSRTLITRDRSLFEKHQDSHQVLWLEGNSLNECVQNLSKQVPIDWTHNPFSRCLVCNEQLSLATETERRQVPEDVLTTARYVWFCHHCQKAYWEGSHTKRMLQQLIDWQNQIQS